MLKVTIRTIPGAMLKEEIMSAGCGLTEPLYACTRSGIHGGQLLIHSPPGQQEMGAQI